MSDQRYHAYLSVALFRQPSAWSAIRAVDEALRGFIAREGGDAEAWRADYRASTPRGAFGTGESVEELRDAWERNHLEVDYFSLNLHGREAGAPVDYVSLNLLPTATPRGNEWGGTIVLIGPSYFGVNTFGVDLAAAVQKSLRERFLSAEVVASRASALVLPERVPVGRTPARQRTPVAELDGSLLERVRVAVGRPAVVAEAPRTELEAASVSAASNVAAAAAPVAEAPASGAAVARVEREAPLLVRMLKDTVVQVVTGSVAAVTVTFLLAWNLLPK